MYYLVPFCCTCFSFNDLEKLEKKNLKHVYLLKKLTNHLPELQSNPELGVNLCKVCCDRLRRTRRFNQTNVKYIKFFQSSISKLIQNAESRNTLLTIDILESNDPRLKVHKKWKIPEDDKGNFENKTYQYNGHVDMTGFDHILYDEKNLLLTEYESIINIEPSNKKIERVDMHESIYEENQNINCLENIDTRNGSLESPLNVLYSNYVEYNFESSSSTRKTTDGEYLENIQKLNETAFDAAAIETIIHNGYNYDINITSNNVPNNIIIENSCHFNGHLKNCENLVTVGCNDNETNDNNQKQMNIENHVGADETIASATESNQSENSNQDPANIIPENEIINNAIATIQSINSIDETQVKSMFSNRPFKCEFCKRSYTALRYLKIHNKQFHHINSDNKTIDEDNIKCTICEKTFLNRSRLIKHVLTHSNHRPFECEVCKKRFKSEKNKSAHMVYHNSEFNFACSICDKKFITNRILKNHLLTHSDPKFKCDLCNKAFTKIDYLRKHVRTHNEDEKKFGCDKCHKRFLYQSDCITHTLICTVTILQNDKNINSIININSS